MALDPFVLETILRESKNPTTRVEKGGNSAVARVIVSGKTYAVKDYSHRSDGFSRQQREWDALVFLSDACPDLAPTPIWCSQDQPLAIHSWLAGSKPELGVETVGAMAHILETLGGSYARLPRSQRMPLAVDAVSDVADLADQVARRITVFGTATNPDLREISSNIEAALGVLVANLSGVSTDRIPSRTLSPSDFGPHNMIYDADKSKYRVIDLEFFGIDDVHKLIGDTILHPQISWTAPLLKQFLDTAEGIFHFSWARLSEFLPLLSLKWAVIVLGRLARLGDPPVRGESSAELADLALFYSELAQSGHADVLLSRIVERRVREDAPSQSVREG